MALKISYSEKKLREVCRKQAVARRHYNPEVVKAIGIRVDDLSAAEDLDDLPVPVEFVANTPPGSFKVFLADGYYMRFCAVDNSLPINSSGDIEWHRVCRIKLMEISKDD